MSHSASTSTCCNCKLPSYDRNFFYLPYPGEQQTDDSSHSHSVPTVESVVQEGQSKLARIRKAISSLQGHERRLQEDVDDYTYSSFFTGPIHRLSNDILRMVFQEIYANGSEEHSTARMWITTGVCRRWRDIVIPDTSFWTRISFGVHFYDSEPLDACCKRIHLQLARSGSRPLHITLNTKKLAERTHPLIGPIVDKALTRIIKNFHRCISLDLCQSEWYTDHREVDTFLDLGDFLQESPPFELPLIQELKLENFDKNRLQIASRLDFRKSPALKALTLHRSFLDAAPDINWSTLQTFRLTSCHLIAPFDLHYALHAASNLVHLELRFWNFMLREQMDSQDPPVRVAFSLDKLASCVIDYSSAEGGPPDSALRHFISLIRAPHLQDLTVVTFGFSLDVALARQLIRMPDSETQYSNKLVRLAFCINNSETDGTNIKEIANLLADLPTLEQLLIGDAGGHDGDTGGRGGFCITSLLAALQWPVPSTDDGTEPSSSAQTRRRICPMLRELQIYYLPVRLDILDTMIRSRIPHPALQMQDAETAPSTPFKLFLAEVELTEQTRKPAVEVLKSLLAIIKMEGVDVSLCGAHWDAFYEHAFALRGSVDKPECICVDSLGDEVDQTKWDEEGSDGCFNRCRCLDCAEYDGGELSDSDEDLDEEGVSDLESGAASVSEDSDSGSSS